MKLLQKMPSRDLLQKYVPLHTLQQLERPEKIKGTTKECRNYQGSSPGGA